MREIKFRAWDEQKKVMHYDFEFIRSGTEGDDWIVFKSDKQKLDDKTAIFHPLENPYFQQQLEIMQFTGLLDKNGKEIYEGDIANITYNCMRFSRFMDVTDRGVMEWIDKSAQWGFKVENSILNEEMQDLKIEVIGNIYENPELLKESIQ